MTVLEEVVALVEYGQRLTAGKRHVLQSHGDGVSALRKQELERGSIGSAPPRGVS